MKTRLLVGGFVAAGFDKSERHLLVISHSGRGVFSTSTWQRIARDNAPAYPDAGKAIGIGPIAGETVSVAEMDYEAGAMILKSPNGKIVLHCESDGIDVEVLQT